MRQKSCAMHHARRVAVNFASVCYTELHIEQVSAQRRFVNHATIRKTLPESPASRSILEPACIHVAKIQTLCKSAAQVLG